MNETQTLLALRDSAPGPSDDAYAKGLAALERRVTDEVTLARSIAPTFEKPAVKTPAWKTRVRFGGLAALATGALATALVLTDVVGFAGWRGGADSAAASVLHEASIDTIAASDPVVGPGQYLSVQTAGIFLAQTTGTDGSIVSIVTKVDDDLFVPSDLNATWVWHRGADVPYQTFGPQSEQFAQEVAASPHVRGGRAVVTGVGGAFYGGPAPVSPDALQKLSRNPQQLLNHIYRVTLGAGRSPDGEALVWIADTLRSGIVPADLRAALFQAAAGIPGVTVTEQQATLDGRTGIAIGRVESADNTRQDIIIDPATGLVIGEREVQLVAAYGVPAGTTIDATAVTTTVVDALPDFAARD